MWSGGILASTEQEVALPQSFVDVMRKAEAPKRLVTINLLVEVSSQESKFGMTNMLSVDVQFTEDKEEEYSYALSIFYSILDTINETAREWTKLKLTQYVPTFKGYWNGMQIEFQQR